jgi:hypothetical protein
MGQIEQVVDHQLSRCVDMISLSNGSEATIGKLAEIGDSSHIRQLGHAGPYPDPAVPVFDWIGSNPRSRGNRLLAGNAYTSSIVGDLHSMVAAANYGAHNLAQVQGQIPMRTSILEGGQTLRRAVDYQILA